MAKKLKFGDYIRFFFLSIFVAFVLALLVGMMFGFRYLLVNGSSSAQEIPFESFVLTYKCPKSEIYVNDFATTREGRAYITHQVIGIKYEGYFEMGECYSWEMHGNTFHAYYGYQLGNTENITLNAGGIPSEAVQEEEKAMMQPDTNAIEDCNLITMANSRTGNTKKDCKNYERDFIGKVVWYNYPLGKSLFTLRDPAFKNRILLIGVIYCAVVVFVMSNQSRLQIGFYD